MMTFWCKPSEAALVLLDREDIFLWDPNPKGDNESYIRMTTTSKTQQKMGFQVLKVKDSDKFRKLSLLCTKRHLTIFSVYKNVYVCLIWFEKAQGVV